MKIFFKNKTPVVISSSFCFFFKKILGFNIGAITIFPFIFVRDEKILNNKDYINHESIHIRQYLETLLIGFLIIGLIEFLYAIIFLKKSRMQAYYFISLEQEAHQNDQNYNYLKNRKWFTCYKYLNPKNKKQIDFIEGKRIILK